MQRAITNTNHERGVSRHRGTARLWDRSDQWHSAAQAAFHRLTHARVAGITTTFVLAECANASARRPYRLAVDRLRSQLETDGILIRPTDDDWREAWEAYRLGDGDQAGLVDHLSFVVMRRLRLSDAFTNDSHFRAAGFVTLF